MTYYFCLNDFDIFAFRFNVDKLLGSTLDLNANVNIGRRRRTGDDISSLPVLCTGELKMTKFSIHKKYEKNLQSAHNRRCTSSISIQTLYKV
jgi:hypothetical protein